MSNSALPARDPDRPDGVPRRPTGRGARGAGRARRGALYTRPTIAALAVIAVAPLLGAAGTASASVTTAAATTPAATTPATPATVSPPAIPADFLKQSLTWTPCPISDDASDDYHRLLCATYRAPMNWRKPDPSQTVTIAISKLPARTQPALGATLVNPGGPGGAGRAMPLVFLARERTALLASQDIYGFDVRGTGESTNTTCGQVGAGGLDPSDRSPANVQLILDTAELTARYCDVAGGSLIDSVNTENTVADLELMRQLIAAEKINWIGYSAGTWLGAYYAAYHPDRTGHFVLDSNTQFTGSWQESFGYQPMSFQRRFDSDFQPWVAKYPELFHMGDTAAEVAAWFRTLRADVQKHLGMGVSVDTIAAQAMYLKEDFPALAAILLDLRAEIDQLLAANPATTSAVRSRVEATLAAARRPGQRTDLFQRNATKPIGSPSQLLALDAQNATFLAVQCNDTQWKGSRSSLIRDSERTGRSYPLIGYQVLSDPCAFWHRTPLLLPRVTSASIPPVLMIQSRHDPATAYEGASLAHQRLAGSRMVTVEDEGDHGIYASGNSCVDDVVEKFLATGELPGADTSCPGLPLPDPTEESGGDAPSYSAAPTQRLSTNPLRLAAQLSELVHG